VFEEVEDREAPAGGTAELVVGSTELEAVLGVEPVLGRGGG